MKSPPCSHAVTVTINASDTSVHKCSLQLILHAKNVKNKQNQPVPQETQTHQYRNECMTVRGAQPPWCDLLRGDIRLLSFVEIQWLDEMLLSINLQFQSSSAPRSYSADRTRREKHNHLRSHFRSHLITQKKKQKPTQLSNSWQVKNCCIKFWCHVTGWTRCPFSITSWIPRTKINLWWGWSIVSMFSPLCFAWRDTQP